MDKLKNVIKNNKKSILFLFILSLIALITGSIFAMMLNDSDKSLVNESINSFFNSLDTLKFIDALKSGMTQQLILILFVWLIGFSIIGIPIILFSFFLKVFTIGFSVCNIITIYKAKGILLSLLYIFPHHIINIINYGFLTIISLKVSFSLLYAICKRKKIDFKPIMNKYLIALLISVLLGIVSVLLEVYLMPNLINIFV